MKEVTETLQLNTDRSFQERFWAWERVGWGAMLLLVLAALAGLTGTSGPLAGNKVEAGGATITYPRISRWQAADTLAITLAGNEGGSLEVLLPQRFTDVFSVENVTPQPSKVTATPDGHLFEFDIGQGAGARNVNFGIRAQRPAWARNASGRIAEQPFELSFTVLP